MDLSAVMQEVAERLDTISGLRVFAYPPSSVQPPAAVVTYPDDWTYDETYRRGMDRCTLPVVIAVGKVTDRTTRDRLTVYLDGTGAKSVKQILESGAYESFDSLRVTGAEFDVVAFSGVDYMAATFLIDIAGEGA